MKKLLISTRILLLLVYLVFTGCDSLPTKPESNKYKFSFAYLADIHVQPEKNAIEGFAKAIDKVNELDPEFVITGGDLIMDAPGQNYNRSDSLYNIYDSMLKLFDMPVYNTIGNHDVFGLYKSSGVDTTHEMYGKKMYEDHLGKRYYSFDHKGWHFIVLDGVGFTKERTYIGKVSHEQIDWIRKDLQKIDSTAPIIVSVHIPLITVSTQIQYGSTVPNSRSAVITNSRQVLDLFDGYNLKVVLQGHLHVLEDIYVNNTHFVSGGAVSGKWWSGPHHGMEEGFLMVNVGDEFFNWEYIDFGWEAGQDE